MGAQADQVDLIQALVLVLFSYRLARLIAWDEITIGLRERWRNFWKRRGTIGALIARGIECGPCVSFWVSLAATLGVDRFGHVPGSTFDVFVIAAGGSCWMLALDGGRVKL